MPVLSGTEAQEWIQKEGGASRRDTGPYTPTPCTDPVTRVPFPAVIQEVKVVAPPLGDPTQEGL